MSLPPIPNLPPFPLPPLPLQTVGTIYKGWTTHLLALSGSYHNVIAFKLATLSWSETIAAYGYLSTAEADGTVTGSGRLLDDDYTFNPETGWGGGGFPPSSGFSIKFPITGKLSTVNGHDAITLVFNSPSGERLHVEMSGVLGKDTALSSAVMLSGDRVSSFGGRVLGTFEKASFDKKPGQPLP